MMDKFRVGCGDPDVGAQRDLQAAAEAALPWMAAMTGAGTTSDQSKATRCATLASRSASRCSRVLPRPDMKLAMSRPEQKLLPSPQDDGTHPGVVGELVGGVDQPVEHALVEGIVCLSARTMVTVAMPLSLICTRTPMFAHEGTYPASATRLRLPRTVSGESCLPWTPLNGRATSWLRLYRRTGADVPFGDPLPSHGTEMEGWFWRLTDPATGRVVVALCSCNQHAGGDWSTVAIAVEPGGVVRSAAFDTAVADRRQFAIHAEDGSGF